MRTAISQQHGSDMMGPLGLPGGIIRVSFGSAFINNGWEHLDGIGVVLSLMHAVYYCMQDIDGDGAEPRSCGSSSRSNAADLN